MIADNMWMTSQSNMCRVFTCFLKDALVGVGVFCDLGSHHAVYGIISFRAKTVTQKRDTVMMTIVLITCKHVIITEKQSGFRPNHSCQTALIALTEQILMKVNTQVLYSRISARLLILSTMI